MLSRLINSPMQRRLENAGFRMTDHFLMNAGHTSDPQWFATTLENLPEGVTEIGIHPGIDEEWRRIDTENAFCYNLSELSDVRAITFNDL